MSILNLQEKKHAFIITVVSIVLPIAVGILYIMPKQNTIGFNVHILPLINAVINGMTFFVLIGGLVAIKNKNIDLHKRFMTLALILSVFFLIIYVVYHALAASTSFGGEGIIRTIYYFILITHIVLAACLAPLVLITYVRALSGKFDKHRKLAKITLPIWLYVSLTGVLVYIMISPYYAESI